jgi:hypothetical protein
MLQQRQQALFHDGGGSRAALEIAGRMCHQNLCFYVPRFAQPVLRLVKQLFESIDPLERRG